MSYELVRDWMTREVITVASDMPLPEAHQLMTQEEIRRLPVIEGSRLVGIVTLGDVREAEASPAASVSIWELNYLLSRLTVGEIMTRELVTIEPEATIGEAARAMLDNRISGLPVVDGDQKLVGIITESDIFSMVVLHEWHEEFK